MQKYEAQSPTGPILIVPDETRSESLGADVTRLDMCDLALLRAFFTLLDEWDTKGRNAN
jgi:hypothetical protein